MRTEGLRVCRRSAFLITCAGHDRDCAGPTAGGHLAGLGPKAFVLGEAKLGRERTARTLDCVIAGRESGLSSTHRPRGRLCHSMTWSARERIEVGTFKPMAFAVSMLMISSNSAGCSTGRSAGL